MSIFYTYLLGPGRLVRKATLVVLVLVLVVISSHA